MARTFFILGALPFVILGAMHVVYGLIDAVTPTRIVPRDEALIDRMGESTLRITRETDVWRG